MKLKMSVAVIAMSLAILTWFTLVHPSEPGLHHLKTDDEVCDALLNKSMTAVGDKLGEPETKLGNARRYPRACFDEHETNHPLVAVVVKYDEQNMAKSLTVVGVHGSRIHNRQED